MKYRISNSLLEVVVMDQGAELCSIRDLVRETELLWQADPAVWPRHAPVLFPVVGRLKGDSYVFEGQRYALPQHGFARDLDFELVDQGPTHLTFRLEDNEHTRPRYPFSFVLDLTYRLEEGQLVVDHHLQNRGENPLWFSLGAHPGFRCPIDPEKESYADYDLVFEQPETQATWRLSGGLFDGRTEQILENQRILPVTHQLFEQDALVFEGLNSAWVGIRSRLSGYGVRMYSPGWPFYGIWAKPNGDFVCLEPWFGHADHTTVSGELTEKPGILSVEAGASWEASYRVEPGTFS